MAACKICSNLWPETMSTLSQGQRAVMFIDLKDVRASATALPEPCPECSLLWAALSLFKTDWDRTNFNHSMEIYICPGKPLRLNWHDDAIQLEFFSGYKGISENMSKDACMKIFGPTTYVSAHSGSQECFTLIASWLATCVKNHKTCLPQSETALPTRLIKLGSANNEEIILFETNGRMGQYVALSYCWGSYYQQTLRTTAENIESHKKGIRFELLSQTLQDAVTITRALGIEYLWIDALCIIQGDRDDWARESARMASIYLNAFLTISADNSPGCEKGIFNRQIYGISDQRIPYRNGNFVSIRKAFAQEHLLHSLSLREDNDAEPTRSRAWTLQETMLANRTLRYTSKELVWECNEGWYCQCGGASGDKKDEWHTEAYIRNVTALATLPIQTIHEQWRQILSCFTERSLTVETDRLPAISGLASQFATSLQLASGSAMPDIYLAGLWRSDLAQSLCWSVEDDFYRTGRSFQLPYSRSKIWRAPSWTWAAIEGAIPYSPLANLTTCIDIVEAVTTPSTVDKYGQVSSGRLVLKGKIMRNLRLEIQLRKPDDSNTGFSGGRRYAIRYNDSLRTFNPDSHEDWASCTIGSNKTSLTCLLIGFISGERSMIGKEEVFLVLRPKVSSHANGSDRLYERVGLSIRARNETYLATVAGKRKESTEKFNVVRLFDTAPEETITLV